MRSSRENGFRLLETLLWRPKSGLFLKASHCQRLLASAVAFGWDVDPIRVQDALVAADDHCRQQLPLVRHRVRLLVDRDGSMEWQTAAFPCSGRQIWTVELDDHPIDSSDLFLKHKTTQRQVYERAIERHPACDDVLLWNERGELTESTRANLVLQLDGQWLTPAASCGLLPGTYRAEWIARGRIKEALLPKEALAEARKILLINSLRGTIPACWAGAP